MRVVRRIEQLRTITAAVVGGLRRASPPRGCPVDPPGEDLGSGTSHGIPWRLLMQLGNGWRPGALLAVPSGAVFAPLRR